jgi:hypothetical protein
LDPDGDWALVVFALAVRALHLVSGIGNQLSSDGPITPYDAAAARFFPRRPFLPDNFRGSNLRRAASSCSPTAIDFAAA